MSEYFRQLFQLVQAEQPQDADVFGAYAQEMELIDKPVSLHGTNGKAILLVHGWSSTPYEMRPLAAHLHAQDYTVLAPQLSGHGTRPQDLMGVTWQHWLADVETAYEQLRAQHEKVFVGGVSLGGTLSLLLAQKRETVDGLVLMGTPYEMRWGRMIFAFAKMLRHFRDYYEKRPPLLRRIFAPFLHVVPGMARATSYQEFPVDSMLQVWEAVRVSVANLHKVRQPCFLIQSQVDDVVATDSIHRLGQRIASSVVYKKMLANAYHNFIADRRHNFIFKDIVRFLEKGKV